MSSGLNTDNPSIVSAFHAALVHQGLVVLALMALLAVAWNVLRGAQLRRAAAGEPVATLTLAAEPPARRLLRISFGLLWVFDGILQAQSAMPLGMGPDVIQPAAGGSPGWVQHLVNLGVTIWSYHPVTAAAAAVWIQVGIGLALLAAPRGTWSRVAAAASIEWGLVVWAFGEAFGGIFAPGSSWLFGTPGGVLFYVAAAALLVLPESAFDTPKLGRAVVRVVGAFFLGMALLQAWPGRGFWQGRTRSGPGALLAMVQQMAQTPQPHLLSSWLSAFAAFDAGHGWAVNLAVVVALAAVGLLLASGRPDLVRVGAVGALVLCLADWVLVQDLGFLGGVGTDPNSMVPLALLLLGGTVALLRPRVPAGGTVVALAPAPTAGRPWRERLVADPAYTFRAAAAGAAAAVVLLGAAPMAAAAAEPHADPLVAEAVDGGPQSVDAPAPSFSLVDQDGTPVTLGDLRKRTVVLTFLDPVCTSDCPLIAQELRAADAMLGGASNRVWMVAVDANPSDTAVSYLRAFTAQEHLGSLPNWRYLTGSLPALQRVWSRYGVEVNYEPGGAMIAHSDLVAVIDPAGRLRELLNADPGPGTQASESSFASLVVDAVGRAQAAAR